MELTFDGLICDLHHERAAVGLLFFFGPLGQFSGETCALSLSAPGYGDIPPKIFTFRGRFSLLEELCLVNRDGVRQNQGRPQFRLANLATILTVFAVMVKANRVKHLKMAASKALVLRPSYLCEVP